jgi:hypothetical protein
VQNKRSDIHSDKTNAVVACDRNFGHRVSAKIVTKLPEKTSFRMIGVLKNRRIFGSARLTDNSNYAEQDGTDRGEDRRLSGVLYGGQGYVIHDFEKNPIEFVFVKHATPR